MANSNSPVKSNKMAVKKAPAAAPAPVAPAPTPAPKKAAAAPKAEAPKKAAAPAKVEVVVPETEDARHGVDLLAELHDHLKALGTEFTARVRTLVAEAVDATKALKRDARNSKKRVKRDPATMSPEERTAWETKRSKNAFLKMRLLTDELSSFMGLPPKSERSQTDVTKFISSYVKQHNCFDPTFKRRIIPDAKLGKLLRVKDGEEVTYLNLQRFLKVHFVKTA
jgi:chromatin remodeling complex protein RSC6